MVMPDLKNRDGIRKEDIRRDDVRRDDVIKDDVIKNDVRRDNFRREELIRRDECSNGYSCTAFTMLHIGYTILPILAGLDKFTYLLTNWTQYLSAPFNVFGNAHTTMMVVGAIEIMAGIGVWLKPKIFSHVVAVWLLAIIINLLILGNFYDVALRDFGLMIGAVALGLLSQKHNHS